MKRLVVAFCLFLATVGAYAADTDAAVKQQINAFVDGWHDDAAHARPAYFDKIAKDGVYIGTDKTEQWHRDEFMKYAKSSFDAKKGFTLKPMHRNVYLSADKSIAWFDELLDSKMGVCQGSGVLRKTPAGYEIVHYQLSMAVPNEVNKQVGQLIKEHEAKQAAK
jgi:hypothetical protein